MDYTTQKVTFRIRKVLRYAQLYGISRTAVKIRGQYHLKRRYNVLPSQGPVPGDGGHVGIIGCGNFAYTVIAYYLARRYGQVIRGAMDIDIHRAASLFERYGLRYYTDDARKIIEDPAIDLVFIASNHASHADYAVDALHAGKSVHIEKPHAVDRDQLIRICRAMSASGGRVSLGFNRPKSRIGQMIKYYLDSQSGAATFSWFVAGHKLEPDHWYLKEGEGGRVLGNLCHWTDFTLQLVAPERRYPVVITPTKCDLPDCDVGVSCVFGDKSLAVITFGARGEPFEGIREQFAAQRGGVLVSMSDFENLRIDVLDRRIRYSPMFRDHGHEATIMSSYAMSRPMEQRGEKGCSAEYVWETGELFLKTKEALERNNKVVVTAYDPSKLMIEEGEASSKR